MASIRPRYSKHGGHLIGYQVRIDRIRKGQPAVHFAKLYDTKAEAEREAAIVESEIARNTYQDRGEIESTTLSEALDRYEREISALKKTAGKEKTVIARWKRHDLAVRSIASLRATDFAAYRDERLAEGLAGNSVRLELALISHLFTIGIKEWAWPATNPILAIRSPKIAPGRERRLDPGKDKDGKTEEARLLGECAKSRSECLDSVVRIALATGMRQSEILSLRWEDIDLEHQVAHLTDTKDTTALRSTGRSRDVPLSPAALAVLRGLLPGGGDPAITLIQPPNGRIFQVEQKQIQHSFARCRWLRKPVERWRLRRIAALC
jgi:integrase